MANDNQNADASGGNQTASKVTNSDSWPVGVQFIFAVLVLLVVSVLLIGLPILSASIVSSESGIALIDVVTPMFAVLIALTSVLVTGTFVFMTFRIDRGTKLKAEQTALETARTYLTYKKGDFFKEVEQAKECIKEKAKGFEEQMQKASDDIESQARKKKEEIEDKDSLYKIANSVASILITNEQLDKRIREMLAGSLFAEWLVANPDVIKGMEMKDIDTLINTLKRMKPPRKFWPWS